MFIRPCEGAVTSRFQKNRLDPVSQKFKRDHVGTDIAKTGKVPIRAIADGNVTLARNADTDGFGKVVFMEHLDARGRVIFTSVYAHMDSVTIRTGRVKQGSVLGYMGNTGNSTGQHLHLELHIGKREKDNRNAVDVMMYLPLEVVLKKGDEGPNVKLLQQLLVDVGYLSKVDGLFGLTTEKAVKSFQNAQKLTVDGLAGLQTIQRLKLPTTSKPAVQEKKEGKLLELSQSQQDEFSKVFKNAREKGIFSSSEHEKDVRVGKMTESKAVYLVGLIASAALNNGKRLN